MKSRTDAAVAIEDRALYELLMTVLGIGCLVIAAITAALLSV